MTSFQAIPGARGAMAVLIAAGLLGAGVVRAQTNSQVLAWNNLGMHCMDDDFSVFAILPPYNTVLGQVVVGTNGTALRVPGTGGTQMRYQAVLDADGSINTTSVGKNNFWDYVQPMLGVALAPDAGLPLPGFLPAASMPGAGNALRPMPYETTPGWYVAWGVPITPYDDDLQLNTYPLMHVVASGGGVPSASTDIVLPVSCRTELYGLPRVRFGAGGPAGRRLGLGSRPEGGFPQEHPAPA